MRTRQKNNRRSSGEGPLGKKQASSRPSPPSLRSAPTQQPQTNKYVFAIYRARAPRIILFLPRAPLKTKITNVLLEAHVPLTATLCLSLHLSLLPYVLLKCVHSRSCVGSFCFSFGNHGYGHHLHSICSLC